MVGCAESEEVSACEGEGDDGGWVEVVDDRQDDVDGNAEEERVGMAL